MRYHRNRCELTPMLIIKIIITPTGKRITLSGNATANKPSLGV